MKNPLDQFIQSAKEVRLSDGAAAHMRERLIAHMREHPVSATPASPYQRFFGVLSPFSLRQSVTALSLILIVVVGGMSTYAATGALPGDVLYPLKVNVVEPLRGFTAVSPEAKAEFKASLVNTRLSEVEQLATQEKLTPEEGKNSKENFDHSLKAARDTIKKLSHDNPNAAAKLNASFAASLGEHEKALNTIEVAASSTNAVEAHAFAAHIRDTSDELQNASTTILDNSPSESIRGSDTQRGTDGEKESSDD